MAGPSPQLLPVLHGNLQHYASDDHAPADARRHVRVRLNQWGLSSTVEDMEAVASELVTNAVLYGGGGGVTLGLERTRTWVIVRIWDGSPQPPLVRRDPDPLLAMENGRGLVIVAALSSRWGWYPEGAGKAVWAAFEDQDNRRIVK